MADPARREWAGDHHHAVLLSIHLLLIVARHHTHTHTQFPGPKRTERRVVGLPMFPAYVPRTLARD